LPSANGKCSSQFLTMEPPWWRRRRRGQRGMDVGCGSSLRVAGQGGGAPSPRVIQPRGEGAPAPWERRHDGFFHNSNRYKYGCNIAARQKRRRHNLPFARRPHPRHGSRI
jgi:hypothetical protein